jgi:hypothetical protein
MSIGSYVITAQYGRCIEGIQDAEERAKAAHARRDYAEFAACIKERDDWCDLARVTPQFLERAA